MKVILREGVESIYWFSSASNSKQVVHIPDRDAGREDIGIQSPDLPDCSGASDIQDIASYIALRSICASLRIGICTYEQKRIVAHEGCSRGIAGKRHNSCNKLETNIRTT